MATDPFDTNLDFFYRGGRRGATLETLKHLVHYADLLLLLTGVEGVGKTTLVRRLLQEDAEILQSVYVRPDASGEADRLLQEISSQLKLQVPPNASAALLLDAIEKCCRRTAAENTRTVFVIDDAHQLAQESLQYLFAHLRPLVAQGLFSVLLIADSSVASACRRWSDEYGESDGFHQIELTSLSDEESRDYLLQRFTAASWKGKPEMPGPELKQAVEQAQGNPGALGSIVPNLWLCSQPAPRHKRVLIAAYWRWLVVMILLLAGSFALVAYQYRNQPDTTPVATQDAVPEPAIRLRMAEDPLLLDLREATEASVDLEDGESAVMSGVGQQSESVLSTNAEGAAPADEPSSSIAGTIQRESLSGSPASDPADVELPSASQPVAEVASTETAATQSRLVDLEPEPEPEPEPMESASPEPPAQSQPDVAAEKVVVEQRPAPAEPVATSTEDNSKPAVADVNVPAAPKSTFFRDEQWLAGLPANRYTVQLLGSFNEDTALNFIRSLPNSSDYIYIRSERKGQDWFVVLHGTYPSMAAAKDTVAKYPARLKKLTPWIRKIKGIQEEAQAGR